MLLRTGGKIAGNAGKKIRLNIGKRFSSGHEADVYTPAVDFIPKSYYVFFGTLGGLTALHYADLKYQSSHGGKSMFSILTNILCGNTSIIERNSEAVIHNAAATAKAATSSAVGRRSAGYRSTDNYVPLMRPSVTSKLSKTKSQKYFFKRHDYLDLATEKRPLMPFIPINNSSMSYMQSSPFAFEDYDEYIRSIRATQRYYPKSFEELTVRKKQEF